MFDGIKNVLYSEFVKFYILFNLKYKNVLYSIFSFIWNLDPELNRCALLNFASDELELPDFGPFYRSPPPELNLEKWMEQTHLTTDF